MDQALVNQAPVDEGFGEVIVLLSPADGVRELLPSPAAEPAGTVEATPAGSFSGAGPVPSGIVEA
eukprot:5033676-Lingulodinium_polyedra.AAC.1